MGSWADLRIGDFTLASTKDGVDPTILMLFTEGDKRTYAVDASDKDNSSEDTEPFTAVEYVASLAVVKDRLEFMGFTLPVVREAFDTGVEERLDELERRRDDPAWRQSELLGVLISKEQSVLRGLSLGSWLEAFAFILQRKFDPDRKHWYDENSEADLPLLVRFLLGASIDGGLWFPLDDFRVFMRAAVEVTGTDAQVTYDLSNLSAAEYISHDEDLCGWARRETADEFMLNHKVVVLTEGISDSRAIEGALKVLYPHLTEYYSFMDFQAVRAPGGAGALVATLKAFIGAGIVNRIIAVFDNDTAARSAVRGLRDVPLPNNVRVIHYPDLDLAREYPTLGPQGITKMNVNGLAGGLELYFGVDILRQSDGGLTPVQWRGYDDALGQYQGELMNKADLHARFTKKLKECLDTPSAHSGYDWTGMRLIVECLRMAFHDA
jgi:hypothetical protein